MGSQAFQVAGIHHHAHVRHGLDRGRIDIDHVGHRVDHDAEQPLIHRHDDHHGVVAVAFALQSEAQAQVHDRHDGAAQVEHAQQVVGGLRDARHPRPAADLAHGQDVDAVLLAGKVEGELLQGICCVRVVFVHGLLPDDGRLQTPRCLEFVGASMENLSADQNENSLQMPISLLRRSSPSSWRSALRLYASASRSGFTGCHCTPALAYVARREGSRRRVGWALS